MKEKLIALLMVSFLFLTACSGSKQKQTDTIYLQASQAPNMIILQEIKSGDLVCCRDTEYSTAEECARALEKECFVRVKDLPYRTAKYDFLTTDTYPTRRWRENEEAPRW